jgi:hypothetical protein
MNPERVEVECCRALRGNLLLEALMVDVVGKVECARSIGDRRRLVERGVADGAAVIVIAATMGAIALMLRRQPEICRSFDIGTLAVASALVLFMPRYSLPPYLPSGRPILQKIKHLAPQRAMLLKAKGSIILGDWSSEVAS